MATQRRAIIVDDAPPVKNKGGRPKGAMSKIAEESRAKAMATGDLPHEFLLRIARGEVIYRDDVAPDGTTVRTKEVYDFEARKDAAKAAAPYYAPKISTVEVIHGVPDNELDLIIAQLAAEAGIGISAGGEDAEDEGEGSST